MTTRDEPYAASQKQWGSGRVLDAAIAEHLFGWGWVASTLEDIERLLPPPASPPAWKDWTGNSFWGLYPGEGTKARDYSGGWPLYSSSWDAMGRVIHAMESLGWEYELHSPVVYKGHRTALFRHLEFCIKEIGVAPILPGAVAYAALNALEALVIYKKEQKE